MFATRFGANLVRKQITWTRQIKDLVFYQSIKTSSNLLNSNLFCNPASNFSSKDTVDMNELADKTVSSISIERELEHLGNGSIKDLKELGSEPENPSNKRSSAATTSTETYKHILNRVLETCKLYLDAKPDLRAKVGPESRFYYVKKRLDLLNPEEQKTFRAYLGRSRVFFQKRKLKTSPKKLLTDRRCKTVKAVKVKVIEGKKGEAAEILYTYKETNNSKKIIKKYLHVPRNGPILFELILEFLDEHNNDFKFHMSEERDEKKVGKIVEAKKRTLKVKDNIKKHVVLMRKRYERLDKQIFE